jgi:small GTP-binding protein
MNQLERTAEFKVVVLGDTGTGKTSLVLRFIEGYFTARQQSTIGAFFLAKKLTLKDGSHCKMQLWDTAGQERFRAMAPMYYRNASAAIICFDITNEDSFAKMKDWVEELQTNIPKDEIVLTIAATKCDLESERAVSRQRTESFAARVNAFVAETSAKDNKGVEELFQKLSEEVMKRRAESNGTEGFRTDSIQIARGHVLDTNKEMNKSGCC